MFEVLGLSTWIWPNMVPFRLNNLLQELTSIDKMHTRSLFFFVFFFSEVLGMEKKNQVGKELEMAGFSVLIWVESMAEPLMSKIIHNYN